MQLLFLSNFYPPASRGGYEQWCQEVLDGLQSRGHDIIVLTSDFGKNKLPSPDPAWVLRSLRLEMELASLKNALQFFTHRKLREQENLKNVHDVIERFKPDVALIWGMWNLHYSIPALIESRMGMRVVYYMGDYWPTLPNPFKNYWDAPARSTSKGIPKFLLKPFAKAILAREKRPILRFEHILFPSKFMLEQFKEKQIGMQNTRVINGAIDTIAYLNGNCARNERISLLYMGRLSNDKGVHVAIKAVGLLAQTYAIQNFKLTIVGDGEPEYESYLRDLVLEEGVERFVNFLPAQPKESIPSLYCKADILLFTSIWPEPFGRVIVEAMAAGVAVVGSAVGGAAEILTDNVNALVVNPGNVEALAGKLKQLIESPALRRRLQDAARWTAVNQFDLKLMVDGIEDYLRALAA